MSQYVQLSFHPDSEETEILRNWWTDLEDNRANRASLRRAKTILEVVLQPAFVDMLRRIEGKKGIIVKDSQILSLAAIAGVLSGVEKEVQQSLAQFMALPPSGREAPRVSPLRFRRLLVCHDPEEILTSFKRMLRLLDNSANISDLARRLYWWDDKMDRNRREMALEYYRNVPATV